MSNSKIKWGLCALMGLAVPSHGKDPEPQNPNPFSASSGKNCDWFLTSRGLLPLAPMTPQEQKAYLKHLADPKNSPLASEKLNRGLMEDLDSPARAVGLAVFLIQNGATEIPEAGALLERLEGYRQRLINDSHAVIGLASNVLLGKGNREAPIDIHLRRFFLTRAAHRLTAVLIKLASDLGQDKLAEELNRETVELALKTKQILVQVNALPHPTELVFLEKLVDGDATVYLQQLFPVATDMKSTLTKVRFLDQPDVVERLPALLQLLGRRSLSDNGTVRFAIGRALQAFYYYWEEMKGIGSKEINEETIRNTKRALGGVRAAFEFFEANHDVFWTRQMKERIETAEEHLRIAASGEGQVDKEDGPASDAWKESLKTDEELAAKEGPAKARPAKKEAPAWGRHSIPLEQAIKGPSDLLKLMPRAFSQGRALRREELRESDVPQMISFIKTYLQFPGKTRRGLLNVLPPSVHKDPRTAYILSTYTVIEDTLALLLARAEATGWKKDDFTPFAAWVIERVEPEALLVVERPVDAWTDPALPTSQQQQDLQAARLHFHLLHQKIVEGVTASPDSGTRQAYVMAMGESLAQKLWLHHADDQAAYERIREATKASR